MSWDDLKNELLKDKATKRAYDSYDLKFDISLMITEARIQKNVSQSKLAEKMGTKQPSIARAESGATLPSLTFLEKMAAALGTELVPPIFKFMQKQQPAYMIMLNYNFSLIGAPEIRTAQILSTRNEESAYGNYSVNMEGLSA